MNVIRTALAELVGMFIDDGQLALTLIALIAVVTLVVKSAWIGPLAGGLLHCSPAASPCCWRASIATRGAKRRRATRARSGRSQQAPAKRRGRPVPPHSVLGAPGPCTVMTMRRFFARPSGVAFESTGWVSPNPLAEMMFAFTPCETR